MADSEFTLSCDNNTFPDWNIGGHERTIWLKNYKIEGGSHSTVDLGDGFVQESFIVFMTPSAGSEGIQGFVKRAMQFFNLAHDIHIGQTSEERVRLTERVKDEQARRTATVIGGTITQIPDSVLTRNMRRDGARYAITIDRYIHWEYDTELTYSKSELSMHGGYVVLPPKFSIGGLDSRTKTVTVRGHVNQRFKKLWMGIKPAYRFLNNFDPEIRIESDQGVYVNGEVADWQTNTDTSYGFIGGEAVRAHWNYQSWSDNTARLPWARTHHMRLTDFNENVPGTANEREYIGDYHLLLRYQTTIDQGETYGIRAGTGWLNDPDATQLAEYYVPSTNGEARYIDLGVISIGAKGFNAENKSRIWPGWFTVSIHATVIDPTIGGPSANTSFIFFDNMFLVPADRYLYAEMDTEPGAPGNHDKMVEFYQEESGGVYGYVVERTSEDNITSQNVLNRKVFDTVTDIEADTWRIPWQNYSVLVIVADAGEGTALLTGKINVDFNAVARTLTF